VTTLTLAASWLKKNAVSLALLLALIIALIATILFFWLKVRGHKITHLISLLQVAQTKNEVAHLQAKKTVLEAKGEGKREQIKVIDAEIREQEKRAVKAKAAIEGLSNEEVAARFTDLGF